MTLKDLSKLEHDYQCSRSSMRPDYIPIKKFSDNSANSLTKAVITFLQLSGNQAERISNTGRYIEGKSISRGFYGVTQTKGKFIKGSGTNGTADISATINGKSVKIEIKYGKDKQSEAQKKYQLDVERAGGVYLIVRTWDDFYKQYSEL